MDIIIAQIDAAIAQAYPDNTPYIVVSNGKSSYRLNPTPERLTRFKADYIAAHKVVRKPCRPRHPSVIVKMSDAERIKLLTKLAAEGHCDE